MSGRIVVVGDVMIDEYVDGVVERISPEAPVPVFVRREAVFRAGGAANVAANVAALGGECHLVGVVGEDRPAAILRGLLEGVHHRLLIDEDRPTTLKTRYKASGQQILRTDHESRADASPDLEQALLASVEACMHGCSVVILSDYAKGVLTGRIIKDVIALARWHHASVIVDPKHPEFRRYSGADVITPNCRELHAATGLDPADDDTAIRACLRALTHATLGHVLLTRAERGMTLVSASGSHMHISACAREVFDLAGAGDTAVAALAWAMARGETVERAAEIANRAAGIAVGRRGTATVTAADLLSVRVLDEVGA